MSFESLAQDIPPAVFLLNSFIFQLLFDTFQITRVRVAIPAEGKKTLSFFTNGLKESVQYYRLTGINIQYPELGVLVQTFKNNPESR